jgi:hypothetical protein
LTDCPDKRLVGREALGGIAIGSFFIAGIAVELLEAGCALTFDARVRGCFTIGFTPGALRMTAGDESIGFGTGRDGFGAHLGVSRILAYCAFSPTVLAFVHLVLDLVATLTLPG